MANIITVAAVIGGLASGVALVLVFAAWASAAIAAYGTVPVFVIGTVVLLVCVAVGSMTGLYVMTSK